MVIHKILVALSDVQDWTPVEMPVDASIVHVGSQAENLAIWFRTSGASAVRNKTLRVAGTGHPVDDGSVHRGTAQIGALVLHVFE